ncbi:KUP/HAK/KT family potassium transporter [Streptomyces sp. NBC_00696]|uniref:KUP/HAK/KT family potassium transporter n=1 Tax=Streptomyces sp. NBC_00696 TaxID=2903672 RepID=UPI002E36CDFD|nr:KUP/HAK/KT family potassium transporter [Streptomyces sp. NBC_00696]
MADRGHGTEADEAPAPGPPEARHGGARDAVRLAVVVGALGVVFGDIGTSPIYTLQTVFTRATRTPSRSARRTCTAWSPWCSGR